MKMLIDKNGKRHDIEYVVEKCSIDNFYAKTTLSTYKNNVTSLTLDNYHKHHKNNNNTLFISYVVINLSSISLVFPSCTFAYIFIQDLQDVFFFFY